MVSDPYARNMFGDFNPYYAKRMVAGPLVVVLDGSFDGRGLQLIKPSSRALLAGEIHELIVTDEDVKPGSTVDRIAYIGFFEVSHGGVIVTGDPVKVGGHLVGRIAGYDETHMPNHLNIVITGARISGRQLGAMVETQITIG